MRRRVLLTLALLLVAAASAVAEQINLGATAGNVDVIVEESNSQHTVIRFEVGAFTKDAVAIDGETYYRIRCGEESILLNAAEPELPRICRSIIIPDNAKMEVSVISSEFVDFPATPVVPSKGNLLRNVNPDDIPYEFGAAYLSSDWYPRDLAAIREPYILRDYRGTVVELNAFQYNPLSKALRVYKSVTVDVKNIGLDDVNVITQRESVHKLTPDFDLIYSRHFINYGQSSALYTPVGEIGDMLIITYDAFATDMQPLLQWKREKGMKTTMVNVSSVGNTATQIKNFIQAFYDSTNLAFVLLVGDAAQVATPTASGGSADPTYGKVVGTDYYPDIFIGRFSAENSTHVQTQVLRSVNYEKTPYGSDWYLRGTGIASAQGAGQGHDGGEIDSTHMNYIRNDLLAYGYTTVDKIYDYYGTAAMVSSALNNGRSIVNYIGHGSENAWSTTGFSSSNVQALTNDNMLPFIISVACVNGYFAGYTCFAEAWLRSTHNGNPIGAIGAYMSSINQSWAPPMDAQDEVVDILIAEAKTTYGGLCFNGSCKMIDENGSGGADMFNTWHIFGDPSLQVRTKNPAAMTVVHNGSVFFQDNQYEVDVVGVQGALCALYTNGVLYGSAYTNGAGHAVIPISQMLPIGGTLTLTVTGFNKQTVQQPVQVVAGLAILVNSPLPDTKNIADPYKGFCTIYTQDPLKTDSLLLYYRTSSVWYPVVLNDTLPDGEFYGNIPPQSPGTNVDYYFFAANTAGLADTTEIYSFKVIDYGLLLDPAFSQKTAPVADTVWYDLTVTNDGVLDDSYSLSAVGVEWSTTILDATGANVITGTSVISAEEQYAFKLRVVVPPSWEDQFDSIGVIATSDGDVSFAKEVAVKTISAGQPWPIPFTETFLTTTLDTYKWDTGKGIEISTAGLNEPTPQYSVNLDASPYNGDTLISEIIDLRGETNVVVKYYFQRTGGGDSPEIGDNLHIDYIDSLGLWHLLQTHYGDGPDMTEFEQSLLPLPENAYHKLFQVRFRNYGSGGSYDDWFVDDVYIGHPPSYEVRMTPSYQQQFGPAGGTAQYLVFIRNLGLYADSYALSDSIADWDVTFWDETGLTQITSTGVIQPTDSVQVWVKIDVPYLAPLNSPDTALVRARSSGDVSIACEALVVTLSAGAPAQVPWYEPFATAGLDMSRWMINNGVAVVTNAYSPPSAPYAINFDGDMDTVVSQLIDLSGQSGALFTYYFERKGPGDSPENGDDLVFEFKNGSGSWFEFDRQLGSGPDQTAFQFVEAALPPEALHNSFQFRVRNIGSGTDLDDWFVDDIRVDFAPSIAVSPTTVSFVLQSGDSATSNLVVQNGGPGTLNFTAEKVPVFSKASAFGKLLSQGLVEPATREYPEGFFDGIQDIKGAKDSRSGYDVRFDAGGPDDFGYVWLDSDEPGGPAFNWIDIQAVGTPVSGLTDDQFVGPFPLGFTFNYYGTDYSELYICSNGYIGFGPTDGYKARIPTILPSSGVPNNIIAWCWDDLDPTDSDNPGAAAYYHSNGSRMVIQFVNYPEYQAAAGDVINAEIILFANGRIKLQYQSIAAGFDVLNSSVGIENAPGTDGLSVVFKGIYLKNSLAVEFAAPGLWLTVAPSAGSVAPGATDTVIAKAKAAGLDAGMYESMIRIASNDPDAGDNPWMIPVTLSVGELPNMAPVLADIAPQAVEEGETLAFGVSASDPNGTIPTLLAEDIPLNASFTDNGNGTGSFTFTPSTEQAGVYDVRFIAADGVLSDTELVAITVVDHMPQYLCGDANGSQFVDVDDAVYIITYIFASGPAPNPIESGDCNCMGGIDIDDAVYVITYVFAGGPAPCADCPQ
jgi:hypothetical protein